jgi:hypothetical protein
MQPKVLLNLFYFIFLGFLYSYKALNIVSSFINSEILVIPDGYD